jgi:hypothetical protein
MSYTHAAAALIGAAIAATGAWQVQGWRLGGQIAGLKAAQAEAVAESERFARAREQELHASNRKIDHAYQAEKARRAADAAASADALRLYQQALASAGDPATDPAAAGGADDTHPRIAGECAAALVRLDDYARSVASQARALQGYAGQVCVSP